MDKYFLEELKKWSIELNTRDKELTERELRLSTLSEQQNERFEKLRLGYAKLGIIDDSNDENQKPITGEKFYKQLKTIETEYNKLRSENNDFNRDVEERYINDMIIILGKRCNSVCAFKELWKKRRRESMILVEQDYKDLALSSNDSTDYSWIKKVKSLSIKHKKNIESQKELIVAEEKLQDDLEFLFATREKLYSIAEKLFLL